MIPETKTSELAERTFVNLYTENNITFGKGSIIVRNYYLREIPATSPDISNFDLNIEGHKNQVKTDGVLTKTDITKQKSKEQQPHKFQQIIEYIVEFSSLMPENIDQNALGGKSPKELLWTVELEPFSTFTYSVMRNNILALCVDEKF